MSAGFGSRNGATIGRSGSGGSSPEDVDRVFPQGVASGDPRPDSVVLWTRVATAAATASVGYAVALDFAHRCEPFDGTGCFGVNR